MRSFIYIPNWRNFDREQAKFFDYVISDYSCQINPSRVWPTSGFFTSRAYNPTLTLEQLNTIRAQRQPVVGIITKEGHITNLVNFSQQDSLFIQMQREKENLELQIIQASLQMSAYVSALQLKLQEASNLPVERFRENKAKIEFILGLNEGSHILFSLLSLAIRDNFKQDFAKAYSIKHERYDFNSLFIYCFQLKIILNCINTFNSYFSRADHRTIPANFLQMIENFNNENKLYLQRTADKYHATHERLVIFSLGLASLLFATGLLLPLLGIITIPLVIYTVIGIMSASLLISSASWMTAYYIEKNKAERALPMVSNIVELFKNLTRATQSYEQSLNELISNTNQHRPAITEDDFGNTVLQMTEIPDNMTPPNSPTLGQVAPSSS